MALELPASAVPTDLQLYQPNKFPTSYSGLGKNYIDQIMTAVMPQFESSISNYGANVDKYTTEASGMAKNMGTNMLDQVLQVVLNSMVGRGMVNSSTAGTAMGAASGEVLKNISNQTYQAGMEGAKLKIGLPDMLSKIMEGLGKYSSAEDPSIPERTLAALFSGSI